MTEARTNTLTKNERICGKKRTEELFTTGSSFVSYPLRIVFSEREKDDSPAVSVLVSVSKKKFRRAVKRNRIKRLIREAYRLNKKDFYSICDKYNTELDIAFLFLKNELPDYAEIEDSVKKSAILLDKKLSEKTDG